MQRRLTVTEAMAIGIGRRLRFDCPDDLPSIRKVLTAVSRPQQLPLFSVEQTFQMVQKRRTDIGVRRRVSAAMTAKAALAAIHAHCSGRDLNFLPEDLR
jgi:hypothetical protein